jgi:hypothetical protein
MRQNKWFERDADSLDGTPRQPPPLPIFGFSHARARNPSAGAWIFDPNPCVQRNNIAVFGHLAKPSAAADF